MAAHPRPVTLVHGTFENMASNWQALSPLLANHGYCVFALNYGSYDNVLRRHRCHWADRDLRAAAVDLRHQGAQRHRRAQGRPRRSLTGRHDAPLLLEVPRRRIQSQRTVGLAPSNHGTTLDGLNALTSLIPGASNQPTCPACSEQMTGSAFLTKLNAGGDTVPGVRYTVIESGNDEVVTPYTSAFLTGPDVTNILLQSQCSLDQGEHLSMAYDHIADGDVLNALDPANPVAPACTPVAPIVGG